MQAWLQDQPQRCHSAWIRAGRLRCSGSDEVLLDGTADGSGGTADGSLDGSPRAMHALQHHDLQEAMRIGEGDLLLL